ncbi:MAG: magnesium and cobalt transport protein CorA, partial [Verrucomicrobiae bacterium]|nr:magnesium and cobalt transport protein CorA [Verrucomicrobiae bacterium]
EQTEDLRENAAGLRDFFLSQASHRMNEIVKVLTSFSAIFLPLTFLVGVYGMNFDDMPELHWAWAYPALWGVFLLVSGGMFWYFRRKDWM